MNTKACNRRLKAVKTLYDAEVRAAEERYRFRIGNILAHYVYGATREEFNRGPKGPRKEAAANANAAGD